MRIGVLTALYQNLSFPEMLSKVHSMGITAVELGTGAYAPSTHIDLDRMLADEKERDNYQQLLSEKDMVISALSCHGNPIHPDPKVAQNADNIFRKTVRLAEMLNVPVVNTFPVCRRAVRATKCRTGSPAPGPRISLKSLTTSGTRSPSPIGRMQPVMPLTMGSKSGSKSPRYAHLQRGNHAADARRHRPGHGCELRPQPSLLERCGPRCGCP